MIQLPDLTIDLEARTVRRGEQPIKLTSLEYRVFELLAVRAGEFVSRDELAATLGGRAAPMKSNLIDVYVGYLRRKLGRETIATKRGKGYALVRPEEPSAIAS